MLTQFVFRLTQMRYVHAAMLKLANFRPKAKTPAQVQEMIDEAVEARDAYIAAQTELQEGQGAVRAAATAGHATAVRVYGIMKEIYADDATQSHKIVRIPKNDQSPARTLARMYKTSEVWEKLPNPPGSATPFVADDITRAAFDDLMEELETAVNTCVGCASGFDEAEGNLYKPQKANQVYVGAALKLGRALYPAGTPGRVIIDGIPTAPSTQPPGEVNFLTAESHAPGTVILQFEADHATSFEVWRKGPGDGAFVLVKEDVLPPAEYTASGLAGGLYQYQVVGVNSRGRSPTSAVQSIEVEQEEVA